MTELTRNYSSRSGLCGFQRLPGSFNPIITFLSYYFFVLRVTARPLPRRCPPRKRVGHVAADKTARGERLGATTNCKRRRLFLALQRRRQCASVRDTDRCRVASSCFMHDATTHLNLGRGPTEALARRLRPELAARIEGRFSLCALAAEDRNSAVSYKCPRTPAVHLVTPEERNGTAQKPAEGSAEIRQFVFAQEIPAAHMQCIQPSESG